MTWISYNWYITIWPSHTCSSLVFVDASMLFPSLIPLHPYSSSEKLKPSLQDIAFCSSDYGYETSLSRIIKHQHWQQFAFAPAVLLVCIHTSEKREEFPFIFQQVSNVFWMCSEVHLTSILLRTLFTTTLSEANIHSSRARLVSSCIKLLLESFGIRGVVSWCLCLMISF